MTYSYISGMQRDEKMGKKIFFNKKLLQINEEIAYRKLIRSTKIL
jgi:hypothetical protein